MEANMAIAFKIESAMKIHFSLIIILFCIEKEYIKIYKSIKCQEKAYTPT